MPVPTIHMYMRQWKDWPLSPQLEAREYPKVAQEVFSFLLAVHLQWQTEPTDTADTESSCHQKGTRYRQDTERHLYRILKAVILILAFLPYTDQPSHSRDELSSIIRSS
jgi:hypothetical protein